MLSSDDPLPGAPAQVRLTGRLICADEAQAALVAALLPVHIALTRAEPGCLRFEVTPTHDPRVWQVDELFDGAGSFAAHQTRIRDSEWGRMTAGIARDYTVTGAAE